MRSSLLWFHSTKFSCVLLWFFPPGNKTSLQPWWILSTCPLLRCRMGVSSPYEMISWWPKWNPEIGWRKTRICFCHRQSSPELTAQLNTPSENHPVIERATLIHSQNGIQNLSGPVSKINQASRVCVCVKLIVKVTCGFGFLATKQSGTVECVRWTSSSNTLR